jgi:Domain of unknown function (DUF397)
MHGVDPSVLSWRKSSFSEAGNCVEIATIQSKSMLFIRDSKYGNDAILAMPSAAWLEFLRKVRSGITT